MRRHAALMFTNTDGEHATLDAAAAASAYTLVAHLPHDASARCC